MTNPRKKDPPPKEHELRAEAEQATGAGNELAPKPASDAGVGPDVVSEEEQAAAEEIERELAQLSAERDDYLDTLRRVQADFENYRKRVIKEQTALVERATEGLLEQLLPVLDSFELALKNLEADENVKKGVELVYADLLGVLEKAGLSRIEAEGKPFDPNEHEAVMQREGDGEPVVADVLRTGYRLKGRVLRPAMVKVTR